MRKNYVYEFIITCLFYYGDTLKNSELGFDLFITITLSAWKINSDSLSLVEIGKDFFKEYFNYFKVKFQNRYQTQLCRIVQPLIVIWL